MYGYGNQRVFEIDLARILDVRWGMAEMHISVAQLRKSSIDLFKAYGLTEQDAEIVVDCLIDAELAGISTHGVAMIPAHIRKMRAGYNIAGELTIEKSTAAFSVCNANNMIGMLSAWKCMQLAVEKSSESGIHMVLCHHANTFSAAYCYIKYAVEHGKIGVVCCNSPAQMAPLGGTEKLFGTNPVAIGVPANVEAPFLFDMATSAVAKSKINQAMHRGEKIPFGWATDANGHPTDDPKVAVAGLVLPMAGPKGYGLSMAIDIISGLLAHASYLDQVGRFYSSDDICMNVGHTFLSIDPVVVFGEHFYTQMDQYLHRVRTSKAAEGNTIFVPGDLNRISREKMLIDGIYLSTKTVNELNALFEDKKIAHIVC